MKIVELKCPNCNATLENNNKIMFCPYCGGKLLFDDEAKNINFTYRKIDEARIKESEIKNSIRLKELEYQEKEKVRERKYDYRILIGSVITWFAIMGIVFWMGANEETNEDEIEVPLSSEEYDGENYELAVLGLENAGFTDINLIAQEDLVTGWLTDDGSIERISINGDTEFYGRENFMKDAKVVIIYHTFKKKEE